jgi:hypothetical protein
MYNLTFDTPYDREVVSKLRQFRNVQEKYYTPTFVQPERIQHYYDPITVTGGTRAGLPADLFEPRYTLNRNQMVEGHHPLHGGSSDLMRPIRYPPVRYDRRREVKEDVESSSSSSESDGEGNVKQKLKRLQKIGGKKKKKVAEKKEKKPSNRLLKIFN